jgi:hypothetical protein
MIVRLLRRLRRLFCRHCFADPSYNAAWCLRCGQLIAGTKGGDDRTLTTNGFTSGLRGAALVVLLCAVYGD